MALDLPSDGEKNWGGKLREAVRTVGRRAEPDAESVFSRLDMRSLEAVSVGYAGDSTGSPYSTGAAEKAWSEALAELYPERPRRVRRWNKDTSTLAAPVVWADGTVEGGSTEVQPDYLVGADSLTPDTTDVVGRVPDVGTGAWQGIAGAWRTVGGELLADPAYSGGGIKNAGFATLARVSKKVSLVAQWRISTQEGASMQRRLHVNSNAVTSQSAAIRLYVNGSTTATIALAKVVGGTQTVLATFPAGTIPSNAAATWYDVEISYDPDTLAVTAMLNGQTVTGSLAVGDDASMGDAFVIADQSASSGLRGLEIRGDYLATVEDGGPSPYGWLTLYNANYAGGRATMQRQNLAAMFPEPIDLLVIHHGHNYAASFTPEQVISDLEGLIDDLEAQQPSRPFDVVVESENPEVPPAATIAAHLAQQRAIRGWALANGYGYVPIYEAFAGRPDGGKSLINPADGVHPTVPGGTNFQRDVVKAWIRAQTRR